MDSIFDQKFMVTTRHRARMAQPLPHTQQQQSGQQQQGEVGAASSSSYPPTGIHPWHFEQYENEAVFIPAGCPHQVRVCVWVGVGVLM